MRTADFLRLAGQPGRTNLCAICADELGLGLLLQGALAPVAAPEDTYFHDAETLTKERARQLEAEARLAPRGGSALSHYFIYRLQRLPPESAGPLLKVTEEAKYARFIFQTQSTPRKILTLTSRCTTVRLPFLSKRAVLGNMRALNHDAKTADQLGLYDGTLAGTIKALSMKDTMAEIRRELKRGLRGLAATYNPEVLNSLAFDAATSPLTTTQEQTYLARERSPARMKLTIYRILRRAE